MSEPLPLAVDLDGTLIRSDMLAESFFSHLRRKPLQCLAPFFWLRGGRAALKSQLAISGPVDVTSLPYEPDALALIQEARQAGREVALATASDQLIAQQVADHLQVFDCVIASQPGLNLKADNKAQALVQRFGEGGFDYAGNSHADLPVWQKASQAIAINPDPGVTSAAQKQGISLTILGQQGPRWRAALKAVRPHQWLKNSLMFVPLAASHRLLESQLWLDGLLAFLCFSLCASGVYLLNDLLDLPDDRQHPRKRHRPLASGTLPIWWGSALAPLCLASAFTLAALYLPADFIRSLSAYLVLTLSYSLWAKRHAIIDVVILSVLYTLRIIAGAFAMGLEPTPWMLVFSTCVFLSLALVKRYAELHELAQTGTAQRLPGSGYGTGDLRMITLLGLGSGLLSIAVLVLYLLDTSTP